MIQIKIGDKAKQYSESKQRKVRKDKKIRVNCPIDPESHDMLKRLALSCNMTKTHLMAEIVEIMLRNPQFVQWIQDKYKADKYRVIPVTENGKVVY